MPIVASLSEVSGLDPQKKVEVETSIVKAELALSNNDRKLAMEILDKVKDSLVIKVVEIDVVGLTRLSKAALAFAESGNFGAAQKVINESEFSVEIEITAKKIESDMQKSGKMRLNNLPVDDVKDVNSAH